MPGPPAVAGRVFEPPGARRRVLNRQDAKSAKDAEAGAGRVKARYPQPFSKKVEDIESLLDRASLRVLGALGVLAIQHAASSAGRLEHAASN